MRATTPQFRRQYLVAVVIFAALLVASFVLFAQLLVDNFSRSYLEDVLLFGKTQAEEVAKQVSGEGPLYKVIEKRREALAKVSAALTHQEVVESAQVFDERGKLVWSTTTRSEGYTGGFAGSSTELLEPPSPESVVETGSSYQIRVPLQDLGTVVLAVSKAALAPRIALLRRKLFVQTAAAAGLALVLLSAALAFSWHLVRRNAVLEERRHRDEELATLGALAANLAHEIRNPLNALSLNLELLEEELVAHRVPSDGVNLARREVGRLSTLVNDFLVYARPTPPTLALCDGRELLDEVATLLAPSCQRSGVALSVEGPRVTLNVDRAQMSQVLVNLALNAAQALEGAPEPRVVLRVAPAAEVVELAVEDNGPGIASGDLERVREAFFSRRKGGTGLGLAIAERIVTAHGGRLELENRPGGGLLARVVLPLGEAAARPA